MTTRVKSKLSIFWISSVCTAIGIIAGSFTTSSTFAKNNVLIPIIDKQIDNRTQFMCDKIEVLYRYNMNIAKRSSEDSKIWDKCVDDVYYSKSNIVSKIGN